MQDTIVVNKSRMEYMILVAIELLHMDGQHWQIAQAADPKQQAAVLPSDMIAPITENQIPFTTVTIEDRLLFTKKSIHLLIFLSFVFIRESKQQRTKNSKKSAGKTQ